MTYSGQCLCGAIRYHLSGAPKSVALCHCSDCRRSAGAPMVAWAMFSETALTLTQGQPKTINSSGTAMRSFCADCGSGLFYRNAEVLPGIVDVQSGTLDHPEALPPTLQIQTAERLGWVQQAHALPESVRYPAYTLPQLMSEHKALNLPAETEWVDAPDLVSEQSMSKKLQ